MARVNNESSNTDIMRQHQLKKGALSSKSEAIKEVELGVEESQGRKIFDFRLTKCLNARVGSVKAGTVEQLLVPQEENPCIVSDADNQFLLNVVFKEKVNLSAITIRCDQKPSGEVRGEDDEDDFQPPGHVQSR